MDPGSLFFQHGIVFAGDDFFNLIDEIDSAPAMGPLPFNSGGQDVVGATPICNEYVLSRLVGFSFRIDASHNVPREVILEIFARALSICRDSILFLRALEDPAGPDINPAPVNGTPHEQGDSEILGRLVEVIGHHVGHPVQITTLRGPALRNAPHAIEAPTLTASTANPRLPPELRIRIIKEAMILPAMAYFELHHLDGPIEVRVDHWRPSTWFQWQNLAAASNEAAETVAREIQNMVFVGTQRTIPVNPLRDVVVYRLPRNPLGLPHNNLWYMDPLGDPWNLVPDPMDGDPDFTTLHLEPMVWLCVHPEVARWQLGVGLKRVGMAWQPEKWACQAFGHRLGFGRCQGPICECAAEWLVLTFKDVDEFFWVRRRMEEWGDVLPLSTTPRVISEKPNIFRDAERDWYDVGVEDLEYYPVAAHPRTPAPGPGEAHVPGGPASPWVAADEMDRCRDLLVGEGAGDLVINTRYSVLADY